MDKDDPPEIESPSLEPWLIVGAASTENEKCSQKLQALGIPTDQVSSLEAAQSRLSKINQTTNILVTTPLEYLDATVGELTIERIANVTSFLKELVSQHPTETVNLHFITKNAFRIEPTDNNANLDAASLNALGVLVENEHPNVHCYFTDVSDIYAFESNLEEILFANHPIRERAIRGEQWYRQMIERTHVDTVAPQAVTGSVQATAVALRQSEAGNVDSLRLEEIDLPAPRENEVKIRVHSSSLNFKDVLKVYGQIDAATLEDTYCGDTLGVDLSGTVIEVGANVSKFKVGDQVAALSPDSFRSQLNVSADYVIHRPDCLSLQEAASMLSYQTAWFGLIDRARLSHGERVLIHNATGGVGSAAIQIAQWVGAEIFATAGTPEKRKHLRDLGIEHVYDSRSLAFKQEIERDSQEQGVDVVLNAIAGEALAQSFDLLAPFGRFIEIGKKNIADNWGLPMRAFQDNLSFIAVDIDRLHNANRRVASKLFDDVAKAFQQGCFGPIPNQTYPIGEAVDAIKGMARAQHLGKITLQYENQEAPIVAKNQTNRRIRRDGNYLITGGTRGFGLEIAKWIASQGPGKITLVSRSGSSEETKAAMQDLKADGTKVEVLAVDISQEAEVKRMIQNLEDDALPLRGIFHGAVVLRDDFISQLTRESLETVLRPKLMGALHLHHYTAEHPLDIFFCFSSISALVGNKGQAAYVVANAFLDALCQFRRSQGLAANSINWGAISDVGILSRKTDVAALFEKLGLDSISPTEACDILDRVLHADPIQVGAFRADWSKWAVTSPELANPATRFSPLLESDGDEQNGSLETLRKQLISECPANEELTDHVLTVVLSNVSGLLRIAPSQLDPGTSISHLGVDSLAAVELGILLRQSVGVDFSAIQLMAGPSPRSLADQIVSKIAS